MLTCQQACMFFLIEECTYDFVTHTQWFPEMHDPWKTSVVQMTTSKTIACHVDQSLPSVKMRGTRQKLALPSA
jgi:hypothetical protein